MKRLLTASITIFLFIIPCIADEPLPVPESKVYSNNKRFCATMDFEKRITDLYEIDTDGSKTKMWSMYGAFAAQITSISNDGIFLVSGYEGMNLLPLKYNPQEVMLYFFNRGKLINFITLEKLIRNPHRLERTTSHYHWGNYLGFNDKDQFVVKTVDQGIVIFDPQTGEKVIPHIILSTDKVNYKRGEPITLTILNDSDTDIGLVPTFSSCCGSLSIWYLKSDEWKYILVGPPEPTIPEPMYWIKHQVLLTPKYETGVTWSGTSWSPEEPHYRNLVGSYKIRLNAFLYRNPKSLSNPIIIESNSFTID